MKICSKCNKSKPLSEFWLDRRYVARKMSHCKKCGVKKQREWRKRNPEWEKARYIKDKDKTRNRHLLRKYGIGLLDYKSMLSSQSGKCDICHQPEPTNKMLDVDHNHITGQVRGLLCTSCNRMLGHAKDDPEILRLGALYMSRKLRRSL